MASCTNGAKQNKKVAQWYRAQIVFVPIDQYSVKFCKV